MVIVSTFPAVKPGSTLMRRVALFNNSPVLAKSIIVTATCTATSVLIAPCGVPALGPLTLSVPAEVRSLNIHAGASPAAQAARSASVTAQARTAPSMVA